MNIITKHILKNIGSKPFRSIILFVCISICAFVALLSFDIVGNMEGMVKMMIAQIVGTSDIVITNSSGMTEELEVSTECNQLLVYSREDATIKRLDGIYNYFHKEPFTIDYMDYDMADRMALLPEHKSLEKDEVLVTKRLSERNNWKVDDVISLMDDGGNEHNYKVVQVLPEVGLANGEYALFVSKEGYQLLTKNMRATMNYIDVVNDSEANATFNEIKENYYNVTGQLFMDSEENKEFVKELGMMLGLIFMVCLLLVVFVAISLSSRIVCERMSVVGTFRSLGLSSAFTTKLLLFESGAYGVIGALLGSGFYSFIRDVIFDSIFSVEANGVTVQADYGSTNPLMIVLVVVLSGVIMCACPLKEIIKTSKIAIRDIIFDNQDTAYRYNKKTFVAGMGVLFVAIVTFFFQNQVAMQFICFPAIIVSVAMLFPWILRATAKCLSKLFEKMNCPILQLAANEAYSRKSTVGSSVLCVTISVLAIIMFIFVSTTNSIYSLNSYSADVIATTTYKEKSEMYSYIKDLEGVKDVEFIYKKTDKIKMGDVKREVNIFGLNEGGYQYLSAIKECPKTLANEEFAMDKNLAKKLGFQVGDMVQVVIGEDGFMPVIKELKLVALINSYDYDSTSNSILITKDLYLDIYHDYPESILVKCEENADEKEVVASLKKYSSTSIEEIKTNQEIKDSWKEKGNGMQKMLMLIIILGVSLSVIGMVSNQLIGFEGRKRECAVLASVAMERGKIAGMLLVENGIATAISLVVALPLALIESIPFKNILALLSDAFEMEYHVQAYIIFLIVLFIVFSSITLFPIKELMKMKIASQLKYE